MRLAGIGADVNLKICNDENDSDLVVAVASRVQNLTVGYRWVTSGWDVIRPKTCETVYSKEYGAAGVFSNTPQTGALITFIGKQFDGSWVAMRSLADKDEWIQPGKGQICVDLRTYFESSQPEGDPAANCRETKVPASLEFVPTGPGDFTYKMTWIPDIRSAPLPSGSAVGELARLQRPSKDSPLVALLKGMAASATKVDPIVKTNFRLQ